MRKGGDEGERRSSQFHGAFRVSSAIGAVGEERDKDAVT